MKNYFVTKFLSGDGLIFPSTRVYAGVELRRADDDLPDELKSISLSASSFGLSDDFFCSTSRISSVVEANSEQEAIFLAQQMFSEFLDVYSSDIAYIEADISDAGFCRDLSSGVVSPILSNKRSSGPIFFIDKDYCQKFDRVSHVLQHNSELISRLRRSYHWSRIARLETNEQMKVLFGWFALEALFKEGKDDNSVESLGRFFLGFPNGSAAACCKDYYMPLLKGHKDYLFWKEKIEQVFLGIRDFRNSSVHDGFRYYDFDRGLLGFYNRVVSLSLHRCQKAIESAVLKGCLDISDFKKRICFFSDGLFSLDGFEFIIYSLKDSYGAR